MALVQTVAPTVEPLTLTETKLHLRVDNTDEDTLILSLIKASREQAEAFLRRALNTQTWRLDLDSFSDPIQLPYPPIVSISSITYTDADGNGQTLSTDVYELDIAESLVRRKYNQVWPNTQDHSDVISVTYVAGYGATAASVPASIRAGMLMTVGHLFENRELSAPLTIFTVPFTAQHLWMPYRWMSY